MHLSLLASLMPSLLTAMKSTSELVHSEVCLLSALAALHRVVETLPHFISPYLEGLLTQVDFGQLEYATQGGKGISFTHSILLLLALFSLLFDRILVSQQRYFSLLTCIFFFSSIVSSASSWTNRQGFLFSRWLCFFSSIKCIASFTSDLWEWAGRVAYCSCC